MRSRELFMSERSSAESCNWPDPGFDIDDESFAEAIAAGRDHRRVA